MIIDTELFNNTPSKSRTKILCSCDVCGSQKFVRKYNIKPEKYTCKMCHTRRIATKHTKNENFFTIPVLLNSYWAGFIAADGSIESYSSGFRLSLGLQISDSDHLTQLKEDTNFTGQVTISHKKDYAARRFPNARLNIGANKWAADLQNNYSITSRKSLTYIPPKLSFENSCAFFIGLIDGDGHIGKDKWNRTIFSVIGTKETTEWCLELVKKLGFEGKGKYITKYPSPNIYKFVISGKKADSILFQLIRIPVPKMKRKWSKINDS